MAGDGMVADCHLLCVCKLLGLFYMSQGMVWTGEKSGMAFPSGLFTFSQCVMVLPFFLKRGLLAPRPIPTQVHGPGQLFSGSR